ncbi:MAG: hypothetical protein JGK17_31110 [Microcoleus sp. PH2017_10_PVI_O_A]|uniref:hypothetical protein n=1 Tax=unclassified Microcoleus TaxID=2642155 RepID=UPI001DCC2FA0|nr:MULTISPECIES: hypothetical protein [unclassified Microcoleus]MCC3409910.1 hypothetical protein [Microcoleus sp. PH2017_10_PVI_O_A]MCC3464158.1 hypothetical protein [Microcoleus sp. PH2017_11_PCY_U_A]MCC3482499.1 hypothetical protein [Microcoleus sp. PH2017_12_PCY_D_A]MCC3532298.1 hypothetical protein [Microcoleus sp. PH2017_21_RUC_O_A]MCC3544595.1 hypothetical protein [Microcoleus sp. PH2017_22_RUC_O_B]
MILLPHHLEYHETLAELPFFYTQIAQSSSETLHLIQDGSGLFQIADNKRLEDYLFSGELDEQIEFVDAYEEVETDNEWSLSDEWLGSL